MDSLLLHVISISVFLIIVGTVYKVTTKKGDTIVSWKKYIPITILVAIMVLLSLLWIFGVKNSPANDQGWVLEMIYELEQGNYDVFLPYGYLGAVQFQIGIATVIRLIFRLFHSFHYL